MACANTYTIMYYKPYYFKPKYYVGQVDKVEIKIG